MIFRAVHNKENPYFPLSRSAVNDERLSYKAIGIHTYLMSKPDGWEANESDIAERHTEGRSAIRSGIQELIDFGYMVRVQLRKNNRVESWRLDTYEMPDLNPYYKPGQPAKVVTIDTDMQQMEEEPAQPEQHPMPESSPPTTLPAASTGGIEAKDLECENLNVENQTVADLECDFLQVENLQVENRIHSNYIYTVTNELERVGEMPAQPEQHPMPESYPPPPLSASTDGLEALMNVASERANGKYAQRGEQVQIDGIQKTLDKFGIDKVQFREMVDSHLDIKGTKALADGVGDAADRELRKAQQFVVDLCGIGKRFWAKNGINLVWDSWKANDWRSNPSEQQLLEHAAQMVAGKFDAPQAQPAKPKSSKPFGGNSGQAQPARLRNMTILN